ncbi:hypothetical protein DFJ73DRAFT_794181 [Zopfochytrium polystomum]|nr:hypothetical protein DFJ73DRAFT_794181 [Zopfochytrium polystomum]
MTSTTTTRRPRSTLLRAAAAAAALFLAAATATSMGALAAVSQPNAEDFIVCQPAEIRYPANVDDVVAAVKDAIARNQTIRGFAAGHSTNRILCADGGISVSTTQNLTSIVSVDRAAKTVRVQAGAHLATFTRELQQQHGLAILGLVDYGAITVGGAIATGAHSSSLRYGAAVHDHVVGFTVVDGTGAVRNVSKTDGGDGDAFRALQTNLGMLGIVVDVTFQAVDAFKVRAVQVDLSAQEGNLENVIVDQARAHDFANFYWFVSQKTAVLHGFDIVPAATAGTGYRKTWDPYTAAVPWAWSTIVQPILDATSEDVLCLLADARALQLRFNEANDTVGWYGDMYMGHICAGNGCLFPHTDDIEIAIPLSRLPAALSAVRRIVSRTLACFPEFGIYVRFALASESLLGIMAGQDVALVETHILRRKDDPDSRPHLGFSVFDEISYALQSEFGGVPHWGKNFARDFYGIEARLPNYARFEKVRRQFDPSSIFTSPFTSTFAASYTPPAPVAACAVTRTCHCTADAHCGAGYRCVPGRAVAGAQTCLKASLAACGRGDECASGVCLLFTCL